MGFKHIEGITFYYEAKWHVHGTPFQAKYDILIVRNSLHFKVASVDVYSNYSSTYGLLCRLLRAGLEKCRNINIMNIQA